jgi:DNA-binding NtrC family response regulator
MTNDALEVLRRYPWPVNVRELEVVLEQAMILRGGGSVGPTVIFEKSALSKPGARATVFTHPTDQIVRRLLIFFGPFVTLLSGSPYCVR